MIIDLQDFIWAFYRELIFVGVGFTFVSALVVCVVYLFKLHDDRR
jgi:hypothetical protein